MLLLSRAGLRAPAVQAIREMQIDIHYERRQLHLEFYCELLGLKLWPANRQFCGGCGAGDLTRGVRLRYRHDPVIDPMRTRLALRVACLEQLAERLMQREWPFTRVRGFFVGDHHIRVADPSGNLLEVRETRAV